MLLEGVGKTLAEFRPQLICRGSGGARRAARHRSRSVARDLAPEPVGLAG
jgi:hypothetical protein